MNKLLQLLDRVDKIIDDTPTADVQGRFGNPAFRDFHKKLEEVRQEKTSALELARQREFSPFLPWCSWDLETQEQRAQAVLFGHSVACAFSLSLILSVNLALCVSVGFNFVLQCQPSFVHFLCSNRMICWKISG